MEDSLVMRRSRRSTAGNRMEAALAEFKADELGQDVEEDVDFIMGKDEEDAFESDFASTDEEGAQEDVDEAAEKLATEEKGVRKAGRTQLEKITAAAHARQKATFNPQAAETPRSTPSKPKRRVSMGVVINEETGEVVESARKRQSRRTHTMMNTSATFNRMKEEEVKKSALPKKAKIKTRAPTQAELIARALDMEEGNMKEHRDYLRIEEEKRARAANLVRETVQGPLLRWVSRVEEVNIIDLESAPPQLPPKTPTLTPPTQTQASSVSTSAASGSVTTTSSPATPPPFPFQYGYSYPGVPMPSVAPPTPSSSKSTPTYFHPSAQAMPYFATYPAPSSAAPSASATQPPTPFVYQTFPPQLVPPPSNPQSPNEAAHPVPPSQPQPAPVPPSPPKQVERTEKVMKCYLYHEVPPGDRQEPEKPTWGSTMAALFGDHVNWEELKVFTTKGRPMGRPVQVCPITGQPARYLDPRTAVPFANVGAYKTLTQILGHEYVWDEALRCYTAYEGQRSEGNGKSPGGSSKTRELMSWRVVNG